jgi:hypothetical protein
MNDAADAHAQLPSAGITIGSVWEMDEAEGPWK